MSWHIEANSMGKVVLICNDKGHPLARMVDDKDHATAALIAATPDLLEALNTWLAQYSAEEYEDCPEVVQTRAAIAKATGENHG